MTRGEMVDPKYRAALEACVSSLKKLAEYELEAPLQERLEELGERKEFLSVQEHDELMSLVEFTRKRTIEALEAKIALQQLCEVEPALVGTL